MSGGSYSYGTVYKLVPSDGGWTESILHNFTGGNEGYPLAGLVFDNVGNLYGTAHTAAPTRLARCSS